MSGKIVREIRENLFRELKTAYEELMGLEAKVKDKACEIAVIQSKIMNAYSYDEAYDRILEVYKTMQITLSKYDKANYGSEEKYREAIIANFETSFSELKKKERM